jgi:hypothetical protein
MDFNVRMFADVLYDTKVGYDRSGDTLRFKELTELGETVEILIVEERVNRYVDLNAMLFGERHTAFNVGVGEVVSAGAHAESLSRKVHSVSTVQYGDL